MSNIIPPLLSSTPPPIDNIEDDDDEFGDFTTAVDHSYGCDALSIPNTPTKLPMIQDVDINSNSNPTEDIKIVPDDETEDDPRPNPDVPSVPNIPTNDFVQSVENTTNCVPDNDDFNDPGDLNVPSCPTPPEIDDVYREEPPDILDEEEEEEEESVEEESDKCDKFGGPENFEFIDDFADFKTSENETVNKLESVENESFENSVIAPEEPVEFDDFADFKSQDSEDDFGDFTTVQYQPKTQEVPETPKPSEAPQNLDDDDEFGDFDDFTTSSSIPVVTENVSLLNAADAFEKAKSIIEQMFVPMDLIAYDCDLCDSISEDCIFKEIKDVTDTNALTYQWAKSESQKGLLKSLKIDTRNILYGHGRNTSMPKFAANLGMAPLEPIKSELLTPTTPPATTSSTPPLNPSAPPTAQLQPITSNADIPSAQFDWTESGLANPLDSASTILLDLEQLVASLDITTSDPMQNSNEFSSDLALDDWNLWLQSVSKDPEPEASAEVVSSSRQFDTESVNSLQFADIPGEAEADVPKAEAGNFDEFTSFQKSEDFSSSNWNNMVPLRETHINSVENKKVDMEEPGWLKPTILTPVLTRNDKIGKSDVKAKIEDSQVCSGADDLEDDFGGFQSGEVKKTEFEIDDFSGLNPISKETKSVKDSQDLTGFGLSPKIDNNTFNTSIKIDTMKGFTGFGLTPSNVDLDSFKPKNTFIQEPVDFTGFGIPSTKNDPNNVIDLEVIKSNDTLGFRPSNSEVDLKDFKLKNVKAQETQDFAGFGLPTTKQKSLEKDFTPFNQKDVKEDDDFDEFTSFQSPPKPHVSTPQTREILQPNILQPSILQPVPTYNTPAQINWPDPGVTDEELARFDIFSKKTEFKTEPPKPKEVEKSPPVQRLSGTAGLLLVEKSVVVPANKVVLPSKEILLPPNNKVVISKDLVLPILESSPRKYTPNKVKNDEDDWTDFVSSSDVKSERISTPELSLCIPQLSNIQPPKLPIPVITAHGLMQTKIPSTISTQKPPTQQPLHVNPPTDGYQPSIISNQFAMQLNQNLFQTTNIPSKMSPYHKPQNGVKTISNSDDEWSDFVSSRPVGNNVFNGNWSNAQTNIISNPTALYQNQGGLNGTAKRNIPSISSLSELDFVAPSSRSFKSKK